MILLLLALSPIGLNVIRLQTTANQWTSFDTSQTVINGVTALDCEPGAVSTCWSGPASLQSGSWSTKNSYGIGACNVQGCINTPGNSGSNFVVPLSLIQSASTSCQNGQGWQISNACALGSIAIGGGQNLPLQSPQTLCQGYTGLQYSSCIATATPPQSSYVLNGNLLPAKLLGQDGNFTSRFGEQCTASLTEACPSSPLCPSSAPTGCQTLTRTGLFNGQQVQIIDLIYSLGVDLRVQLQGQRPVFTILCNGAGIGLSGLTNGPCAGAAVAALQGPLAFTNTNVLASGKIAVDISAPLFAYGSPYDFYGFWNGYIANSGCVPATNISPCTSHASLGITSTNPAFKDPSQWTVNDFINLPANTLASTAVISLTLSSLGPVYSVTVQKPGGNSGDCQSDLNQGTSATGTCTLTIGGQSLIDVPIVFQELAQVKVNVPPTNGNSGTCYSPSGTVNATCINKNPVTSGTIKVSNVTQTFKYVAGGNVGNITRSFQNSTSPLETIVVKVSDTSGVWGFLIPLGGISVTLNPVGAILTTNSSGYVIFEGVPPPVGAVPYSVSAIDPGGYTLFGFLTIPSNHNSAGPVGVPNLGTGTYFVPVVMVTTWAGLLTIVGTVILIVIVVLAVGLFLRFQLGRRVRR